mgnify:CR=1 FL=1
MENFQPGLPGSRTVIIPRSRQTGLKIFPVIVSQFFCRFHAAGNSLEKLSPLNRASPSHVIRALLTLLLLVKLFFCSLVLLRVILRCCFAFKYNAEPSALLKVDQLAPQLPEIQGEEEHFKPTNNSCAVENTKEVLLQYYAEWSFESSGSSELSLEQGQVVIVRRQQDLEGNPEWWLVEAGGAKGYVPASYLSPITNED